MPNATVVFANLPLAYREAIASAVKALRPAIDVAVCTPQELQDGAADMRPRLVVCDRLNDAVRAHAAAWIVLYPDGANSVAYCIAGREHQLLGIDLAGLLALVDEAIDQPISATVGLSR